jgi:predicted Zn-ribbon and HTH transcriptional regulator
MKTIDPHSDLQEGFEPAPAPPIGPDRSPIIQPQRSDPPARPSLCRAGPCRNYHRFVTQVDAENPRAVPLPIVLPEGTPGAQQTPQGTLYRAPAVFHTETHHYCYPDPGIEMNLGALPVVECNRWDPPSRIPIGRVDALADRRARFWITEKGRVHLEQLAAWEAARAAEAAEAAEAEVLIAQSMSLVPDQVACQACGRQFEETLLDVQMRCPGCQGHALQPRLSPEKTP